MTVPQFFCLQITDLIIDIFAGQFQITQNCQTASDFTGLDTAKTIRVKFECFLMLATEVTRFSKTRA